MDKNDKPFQMRVSSSWLKGLDDWRRAQPDLPSRAETVRRLVDLGKGAPNNGAAVALSTLPLEDLITRLFELGGLAEELGFEDLPQSSRASAAIAHAAHNGLIATFKDCLEYIDDSQAEEIRELRRRIQAVSVAQEAINQCLPERAGKKHK